MEVSTKLVGHLLGFYCSLSSSASLIGATIPLVGYYLWIKRRFKRKEYLVNSNGCCSYGAKERGSEGFERSKGRFL